MDMDGFDHDLTFGMIPKTIRDLRSIAKPPVCVCAYGDGYHDLPWNFMYIYM